jgi:hypothetical protein
MQVNGEQTDRIPEADVGLGLLTQLGGLRMRISNHTRFHPYFQIAPASHKLPHPEIGDEKPFGGPLLTFTSCFGAPTTGGLSQTHSGPL